jgi:hypothetical protein
VLFARFIAGALVCLFCAGTASALPNVGATEMAAFVRVQHERQTRVGERSFGFEMALVAALEAKPDLDAVSGVLAPGSGLTPMQMRRLSELWILFALCEERALAPHCTIDWEVSREESERRERVFKSELRAAFIAFVRATTHAALAVTAASKTYDYACTAEDFDALVADANADIAWLSAREADCTGFWLRANARQPMNAAILLGIARYGLLSRAQRIAVVEYARRQIAVSTPAEQRLALDAYIVRSLAYDYWDAGLIDEGLRVYEGLSAAAKQFVREDRIPHEATLAGHPLTFLPDRPEFPKMYEHEFREQLAGALAVRGRTKEARKIIDESAKFGAAARVAFDCALAAVKRDCPRLEPRALRWLYLDHVLHRPADDPYDLFEQARASIIGWGESGLWIEVLRRTVRDANYTSLVASQAEHWHPEDGRYREKEWATIEATFDAALKARVAEITRLFDARMRAVGSDGGAVFARESVSRVAPKSRYFTEAKMPACKLDPTKRLLAPRTLPDGFEPVRTARRGSVMAVVSLSYKYDPGGGGYWLHLSSDGGKTWESPRYTGLARHFLYEVQAQSCLPMIADDRLQLEVAIKEIDTASNSTDEIRYRRQQTGLYLDIPLAVLRKDCDGDGLTDIAEDSLLLDPAKADSDGDGVPDGSDSFPNVALGDKQTPLSGAMAMVVAQASRDRFDIVDEPGAPAPDAGQVPRWPLSEPFFIRGQKNAFTGLSATQMTLVYSDEEIERINSRKPFFHATWFSPLIFNRTRTRGFISWGNGYAGGTLRVVKKGEGWRLVDLGGWMT